MRSTSYRPLRAEDAEAVFDAAWEAWRFTYAAIFDPRKRACGPHELIQRDAGAHLRQIDGPRVVERHAGKKVMNPQWHPFEFLRRDPWHRAS